MSSQNSEKSADTAALEQSRADGYQAGKQDGMTEGASAERTRIGAILNHEHAAGREAQAKVLALDTRMSVEEAGKVLAVSPVVQVSPAKSENAFAKMMATIPNPDVGTGGDDEGDGADSDEAEAAKVVALFQPHKARG